MKTNRWVFVASILSIMAIVISVIAICTSLKSFELSETAYLGWVVSVLATLVTVLIGWQIFNYLYFEDKMKQFTKDKVEELDKSFKDVIADLFIDLSEDGSNKENRVYYLAKVIPAYRDGNKDKTVLKWIIESMSNYKTLSLYTYNRAKIKVLISELKSIENDDMEIPEIIKTIEDKIRESGSAN